MCNKEKKDKKDKREKKEKRAKKAQSGEAGASGAGASAAKCTLKLVEERKDLLSPVLMSFPPGLLPAERLTNDEETGIRLELRRNTASNRRHQYELRAETSTMSYSANNFGAQLFPRNEGPKLLVGVHDKRTGVVRLVPAQHLYQMKTLVKQPRLPLDPPAPEVQLVGAEAGRAMQEGKRALVSELGSAKAHKKQKSQLAKQISPDAVFSHANLTSDLVGLVQVEAPKQLTPQQARPLHPRFNLSATSPTEVYPREGLIPERAWSVLDVAPLIAAALDPSEIARLGEKSNLYPQLVLKQLSQLAGGQQAQQGVAKRLLYLTYMVRFFGIRRALRPHDESEVHPEAKARSIEPGAWEQLVADFTEPAKGGKGGGPAPVGVRELTPALRQKLIMHILALALMIGNGTLVASTIASSLELTQERTCFYLKQLGCNVKASGSGEAKQRTAILNVPLTFPKASQGPPKSR